MPHVNEEIARKATQALSKGDMQTFIGLHNDDVVLHFPGRGPLAGDYKGKDGLVRLFQKQMEMLDSPPQIENHDILASDDHVAALVTVRAERDDRRAEWKSIDLFHVRDGRLSEHWVHEVDQGAVDRFFAS